MMTRAMILRHLEEIAHKLAELRSEVENLPETLVEEGSAPLPDEPSQPGSQWFVDKDALGPLVDRAFAEMGITGDSLGPETVQEMFRANGVSPEGNIFSQEVIEMRQEWSGFPREEN